MKNRPGGTYTFVFTDIEGSTKMLRALGDEYVQVLREHDAIIGAATTDSGGKAFGSEGDAQNLVFTDAASAIRAAADAQRALAGHGWPEGQEVRVRMGIHSGRAQQQGDDFVGMTLHETARIASAGHGGQVLLSPAARELARDSLPEGVTLRDLGEHSLKDVEELLRIYQLVIEGLTTDFPPLRTVGGGRTELPTHLSSFVGRAEVDTVKDLIDSSRLVTLTGPGGTGKTRLSIRVASEVAERFLDGTYFVALDVITDPDLVMSEVASKLSLVASADAPIDRVISHLRDRKVLLVLDNFEQVVDAALDVARLLKECPSVNVLATSRMPLRIHGEQEFPVPALSVPARGDVVDAESAAGFEAVRLFIERVRAVRPDYNLDDATAPMVVDIVRRLDGLPLAIELAAARVRMLSVTDLRKKLDSGLAIIASSDRDVPERQRTLRAAIEWSHDLLDEADQRLFARFSVMAGGAAYAQAEYVCGSSDELGRDVFDGLESLSDQSLIRVGESVGGESRFEMLVTIREFAAEQLEGSDDAAYVRERHARAFLELAEEAAPLLTGTEGAGWNDRLEVEHDNLRAALDWAVNAGEAEVALRLATALWRFWQVRGHLVEGAERLETALGMPGSESQPAALLSRAHGAAGSLAYWRLDRQGIHRHYAAALDFAREAGDEALLAESLYNIGFAPTDTDVPLPEQYAESRPYYEEALERYRKLEDRPGMASVLWALAATASSAGETEAAERLSAETLALSRELGDPFRTAWAAFTLASGRTMRGSTEGVADLIEEAHRIFIGSGDAGGLTLSMAMISVVGLQHGDPDGWRAWGAAVRLQEETGTDRLDDASAEHMMPDPQTDEENAAVEDGRLLSTEEAADLGLAIIERAKASQQPS